MANASIGATDPGSVLADGPIDDPRRRARPPAR